MRYEGGAFIPAIQGATLCCDDPDTPVDEGLAWGWPLVGEEMADHYAEAGINFTEIRPGPFADEGGADFLPAVRETIERLLARGIYAQVGIIDSWALAHRVTSWGDEGCEVTHGALQGHHKAWIRALVEATKEYPNVVYFDGNEAFRCNPSDEWTQGIYDVAREAGATQLIGSNSERLPLDYPVIHGFAPPAHGEVLNESDNEVHDCARWLLMKRHANFRGGSVLLWKAVMSDAEFFACLPAWVAEDGAEDPGGPVDGPPEGDCPKIARQGMGNVPHNIVGSTHIWDTTTRFGNGNGQVCNDEHHDYCDQFVGRGKGAKCEPWDDRLNLDVSVNGLRQCLNGGDIGPCWEQQGNRFQIRIKQAPPTYTIRVCFGGGNTDKWDRPLQAGADPCTTRTYSW